MPYASFGQPSRDVPFAPEWLQNTQCVKVLPTAMLRPGAFRHSQNGSKLGLMEDPGPAAGSAGRCVALSSSVPLRRVRPEPPAR